MVGWLKNETTLNLDLQSGIVVAAFAKSFPHFYSIPFLAYKQHYHNDRPQKKIEENHQKKNIPFTTEH